MKNYNISPYYDDFSETGGFHQILFKPGFAVQSRELTQLQTILRDQIQKFGNHTFKHGSVVIPGNAIADLYVPTIKLLPTFNSVAIDIAKFEGKVIVGSTTGIKAVVKKVEAAVGAEPITFFLSYITGGGVGDSNSFLASEEVYVESSPGIQATLQGTNHVGVGSLAYINQGVFYIYGSFVHVAAQTVVMSKTSSTPSCHVLLKIDETVVTATEDETLLDPAQGSYNYAAPGADRVKIVLTLVTLPLDATISDDYVEIMRYNQGVLEEHAKYASYSELEKNLARRTFDESGNYLVNGFAHAIRDHLKTPFNNGVYSDGDRDKFVVEVQPGKGYIDGLEIESVGKRTIPLDKGRTADHVKSQKVTIQHNYGRYIYVSNLKSMPNFSTRQVVDLYNDNDRANVAATKIGDVRVVAIDYHAGDPSSNSAIYKLYIDQLNLFPGYSLDNAGGIRFDAIGDMTVVQKYSVPNPSVDFSAGEVISGAAGARVATVIRYTRSSGELYAYRHDHTKQVPAIGDTVTGATSTGSGVVRGQENIGSVNGGAAPIFGIPLVSIKSLKNLATNNYDIAYNAWKRLVINTDGTGFGTASVTDGLIQSPEAGNLVAMGPTGVVSIDKFSIAGGGSQLVLTGGPLSVQVQVLVQVTKSSIAPKVKTLTTKTLSGVVPASTISLGEADIYRIVSITDSSSADVTDRYQMHNGQTDFFYGLGTLELVKTLPASNLTIVFEYFEHSGSGDFFCVDSYATLGVDYVAKATKYVSNSTSQVFDLAKCVDFRPTVGSTGAFDTGGPSLVDVPVISTFGTTSVQYYVPRIDVVYLNKDRAVNVARGIPHDVPTRPSTPESSIEIATIFVPAYTVSVSNILSRSLKNYRFTMSDIKKLENRVASVEYYSTLNSLETSLISYDIVDASTGLNRFKTGYLADNFDNVFTVCDFYNRDNRCTFFKRNLSSAAEDHIAEIAVLNTSSNYQMTGSQMSLPYVEAPLISQTTSTRATNLNPFMVFSWEGVMTIEPSFDTWIETQDLPTIYNTREETIRVDPPRASPPPAPVSQPVDDVWWEPAPVPAPEPTVVVTSWARDLGLVDPSLEGTPAWDDLVYFTVPESTFNQTVGQVNPQAADPNFYTANNDWVNSPIWTGAIEALNTAFDSAVSATSVMSGGFTGGNNTADRFTSDQIINFWQDRA